MTDQNEFVPSNYDNAQNSISSQPTGGIQSTPDLSGESPTADNTMNASETADTTGAQDWGRKSESRSGLLVLLRAAGHAVYTQYSTAANDKT